MARFPNELATRREGDYNCALRAVGNGGAREVKGRVGQGKRGKRVGGQPRELREVAQRSSAVDGGKQLRDVSKRDAKNS